MEDKKKPQFVKKFLIQMKQEPLLLLAGLLRS